MTIQETLTKQAEVYHIMLESARQLRDYDAAKVASENLANIYYVLADNEKQQTQKP